LVFWCFFAFFRLGSRSLRMERVRRARRMKWGRMSSLGTARGKRKNGGSRTVRTGTDRNTMTL